MTSHAASESPLSESPLSPLSPLAPLAPLAPAEVRARRRPLAVLFLFAAELAWALVVATPAHAWAERVWGKHPDGDAALFTPGARDLLVWLGQPDAGLSVTVRTTMVLLLVGAVLMQLPLGALLASLAFSREVPTGEGRASLAPRMVTALRVGVGAFMPLCGVLALSTVAGIVVVALGAMAGSAVDHGLAARLGDERAFTLRLMTLALFLAMAAAIGVIADLARAAVGREAGMAAARGTSSPGWTVMLRGVRTALSVARRGLSGATLAWGWRAALGVALVGAAYAAAPALGGRGGTALWILFFIHQAVVLGRTALRASWLARAIALVAPVQDARDRAKPKESAGAADATTAPSATDAET